MREITLEELLEAGCHFGHQVIRSNPKARDFVFEARDNIQIIDLGKTKEGLDEAAVYIKELASKGGTLLVVGTKRQAQATIQEEVKRAIEAISENPGLFYVTQRWVGGILTNYSEIEKNVKKLKDLEKKLKDPEAKAGYTKKEISLWEKEKQRLKGLYIGVSDMVKTPTALFIIDSKMEDLAVKEAIRMRIPTVAIVDTNSDPNLIDYPIPANDDAVGSIKLIASYIMDAWIEGRKKAGQVEAKEKVSKDEKVSDVSKGTEGAKETSKAVKASKGTEGTGKTKKEEKKEAKK